MVQEMMDFIDANPDIVGWINIVAKELCRWVYETYMGMKLPARLFGAWPLLVINYSFRCARHFDLSDFREGMSTTFYYSDGNGWIGGELIIELAKGMYVRVEVQPGDIVFFQSYKYHHWVQPFVGERVSWVLLSHNTLLAKNQKNGNAPTEYLSREEQERVGGLQGEEFRHHKARTTHLRKVKKIIG